VAYPPDLAARITSLQARLRAALAEVEADDPEGGQVVMARGDGVPLVFAKAPGRRLIQGALLRCQEALDALERNDAAAAAQAAYRLALEEQALDAAGLARLVVAGFRIHNMDLSRKPAHAREAIEAALDEQHRLHPRWGIVALREAAGQSLNPPVSARTISRITKYNPTARR
jgi:hypothetical protein